MKKVFLEISQNSQENACARVSFLIKLQATASVFEKLPRLVKCLRNPILHVINVKVTEAVTRRYSVQRAF